MENVTTGEWKALLKLLLAQRLELNAIESSLKNAGILSDAQIREIRTQTTNTAQAWTSRETDDAIRLLRIHSLPAATMGVPPDIES